MRAIAVSIAFTLVAAGISGCGRLYDDGISAPSLVGTVGSGRFVTESRPVRGFDAIAVMAGGRAIVTLSDIESLDVTAEDNILPLVESTVVNGTLTLGFRPGAGSLSSRGVTYHIGMRSMRGFNAAAGSAIEAHGIDTAALDVRLSAGSTFVGSGSADRLELELSAGSRVDAPALRSRVTTVTLSAGSTALVRVSDLLSGHASAGSQLTYLGNPEVQVQTSAGSTVRRAGS
jgi:hypothetical protein